MSTKDIKSMSALEISSCIKKRELGCKEVAKYFLDEIKEKDKDINSLITVTEEEALKTAEEVQKHINNGEDISPLAGVPVVVKDNICTKDVRTTSGSKILENFVPPYNAGVAEKLSAGGMIVIGKANLDEFAMGGSTETSYYGITKNPWNKEYVPGGSSGGSAAVVAGGMSPLSVGSDTGGSIRQPCAFCNLTGIKPTYGSVSRYGLMAYASSLDQIGPLGKNIEDCGALLSLMSGKDKRDSTSVMDKPFDFTASYKEDLKGIKVGLPLNYFEEGLNPEVKEKVLAAAEVLKSLGAEVEEFTMPGIQFAVPAYYIIACAEASSNLSRYDGIKYGYSSKDAEDLLETYYKSRSEGFGTEVKRRIMLGSFVLSSGYFDAYYKKALQVRGMIKENFNKAFERFDMIISPVSPNTSYKIGAQISDPIAMYMADIYTVSINLAGIPAVALPCGFSEENNMPVGMQLIGNNFSESTLIKGAFAYQSVTDFHKKEVSL